MPRLVGGDGGDVCRTQAWLSGLGVALTRLVVGAAFTASVARVGAGPGMAGVSKLRTVQVRLIQFCFFLKMAAADTATVAVAVRTALLWLALSV